MPVNEVFTLLIWRRGHSLGGGLLEVEIAEFLRYPRWEAGHNPPVPHSDVPQDLGVVVAVDENFVANVAKFLVQSRGKSGRKGGTAMSQSVVGEKKVLVCEDFQTLVTLVLRWIF